MALSKEIRSGRGQIADTPRLQSTNLLIDKNWKKKKLNVKTRMSQGQLDREYSCLTEWQI